MKAASRITAVDTKPEANPVAREQTQNRCPITTPVRLLHAVSHSATTTDKGRNAIEYQESITRVNSKLCC